MNKKVTNILKCVSNIIGIIILIGGFLLGLWVGLYLMFYGGIIQIINGINPLNAIAIATGVCKVIFCEIAIIIPIIGTTISCIFFEWGI